MSTFRVLAFLARYKTLELNQKNVVAHFMVRTGLVRARKQIRIMPSRKSTVTTLSILVKRTGRICVNTTTIPPRVNSRCTAIVLLLDMLVLFDIVSSCSISCCLNAQECDLLVDYDGTKPPSHWYGKVTICTTTETSVELHKNYSSPYVDGNGNPTEIRNARVAYHMGFLRTEKLFVNPTWRGNDGIHIVAKVTICLNAPTMS